MVGKKNSKSSQIDNKSRKQYSAGTVNNRSAESIPDVISQQESDVKQFLWEAYTLLFRNNMVSFPATIMSIFNNKLTKQMDTSDFLSSKQPKDMFLRQMILNSARIAFHISVDKFIMADFDIPEVKELEVSRNFEAIFILLGIDKDRRWQLVFGW